MKYYHDLVTQKSWEALQKLKHKIDFILIGGWAVYLYTKTLKSKDIDIIVEFSELSKLEKHYRLVKNERLKKYEALKEEVEIDIYLPYYSKLGIPVEKLIQHTDNLEGFIVLKPDYLIMLKIYTLAQRGRTPKGKKDFIDIIALVKSYSIDWKKTREIVRNYGLEKEQENFKRFLNEYYEIPELNLNRHLFAKMKKTILTKLILP